MSSGGVMAGPFSAVAASAVSAYRRVAVDSNGQVAHAGEVLADGVSLQAAAAGELCPVKLLTEGGTFEIVAADAISKGSTAHPDGDGKVSATAGAAGQQFKALDASTADGDVIECLLVIPAP